MVRSPCDKNGIKKGPWTCQEDNILLSYVQEHGPGHWKSIPVNTGLMRCSKSCRLRWTNYLRPGIKRGNFTTSEEGIIVHLQSILGNKWAAIASYLPQRTDNDIKNYWNTHLKKKLKKYQILNTDHNSFVSRFDSTVQNNVIVDSENASSIYASSTENISKLLESWKRSSPQVMREIQYDDITKENENVSTEDEARPVFSYLENWLLDETPGLVDGFLEISGLDSYYPPY